LIEWGVSALQRFHGMFALALWDELEGRLLLARDRLGIKPLYYAESDGSLAFASEVRSVLTSGILQPRVNESALPSYLRLLWVPDPLCLFQGIRKLEPGHYLTWDDGNAQIHRYWDVPEPEGAISIEEASGRLRASLDRAVQRQLRADVPVGVLLSGGLDSTSILAFAAGHAASVQTYSIRFSDRDRARDGALDDSYYARLAAREFATKHTEIVLDPDVASLLPRMVRHLEDPVADPAAINTFLICQSARGTSTVLLSGAGADELFGGYRKYVACLLAEDYRKLPGFLRRGVLEPMAKGLPVSVGGVGLRSVRFAKKFLQHAGRDFLDRFLGYSTYYTDSELGEFLGFGPVPGREHLGLEPLVRAWEGRRTEDLVDRMTYLDLKYYLPGLGLAYADKASMAASVEVRVPLLDDEIVDLVAKLPGEFRVTRTETKRVLRRAVRGRIPSAILNRPKAPFAAPIRSWMRDGCLPMVQDLLAPSRVRSRGLVNPAMVERMVVEQDRGEEDHSLRIWALLTLETWMQEFIDNAKQFSMPEEMPVTVETEGAL
jgi:asparagine synthase (glutamine-hydrolysing)